MAKRVAEQSADTLRQRHAVARYGQAARHPLCQAALRLWSWDVQWLNAIKASLITERVLKDCENNIRKTKALIAQLRQERKPGGAKSACEVLQKFNQLRSEALAVRQKREDITALRALRFMAEDAFAKESLAAARGRDFAAFKALKPLWERWGQPNYQHDYRTLGLLELFRDEAVKQAWDRDGVGGGYSEVAFGSDKLLSDEAHWPGFTAKELHEHLVARRAFSGGEEQLHQVRRLAKKLGIRLSPDKRGPKLKKEKGKKSVH